MTGAGAAPAGLPSRGQPVLDSPSPRSFVQEPDTDLEVVLEKKGNMDEAHIDQVPSAPTGARDPDLTPLASRGHHSACATPAVAGNGGLSHFTLVLAGGPSGH